ncbi:uncharacterized protein LOC135847075 [Planococcus citri]
MAHQVEFISKLEALKARLNTTIDNYLIIRAQAPAAIPVKPKKNVHLQRITVPIFDGKLMEWRSWWQLYQTAVHNDNEHSDVEKFTYLLTFIGPEVKRVLGNLDPTAENYPIAIDKIVDKYDKPELLKAAYYKALEDTHESTTPTAHRRNIESISSIIANLNAIGVPVDQDILRTKVLSCFPSDLVLCALKRLKKVKARSGNDLSFNELNTIIDTLDERIKLLEQVDLIKKSKKAQSNSSTSNTNAVTSEEANNTVGASLVTASNPSNEKKRNRKRKATGQNVGAAQMPPPPPPPSTKRITNQIPQNRSQGTPTGRVTTPCLFCNRVNHESTNCETICTWKGRKECLERSRRCNACGSLEHVYSACQARFGTCTACGKIGHYALMCSKHMQEIAARVASRRDQSGIGGGRRQK